VKGMWL